MKDIKKLLKQQSSDILPDQEIKENIKADLGLNQQSVRSVVYNNGATNTVKSNNKRLITILAFVVLVVIATSIVLFTLPSNNIIDIGGNTNGKFDDIVTTDDFYAYGAASVGALLGNNNTQKASNNERAVALTNISNAVQLYSISNMQYSNGGSLTDQQVQTVNGYMALVEELLGNSKITHSGSVSTVEGYQYVMNIVCADITGANITYVMYYNKTLTGVETDNDEKEENYNIEGVLLIDGAEYPVEGEYKTEMEEGETESEMRFRAYTTADRLSYIEVEQQNESETEDNETEKEYVYTVYQDGKWTERTVAEYEQENNQISLVLTVNQAGGGSNRLVFRNTSKDAQYSFAVSAWIDNSRIDFTVSIVEENGNTIYRYEYSDGTHNDFDRNQHKGWQGGHDDDDDDDD